MGRRYGDLPFNVYRVTVCDGEKVPEIDIVDSCIMMCMYLMPMNCTGKFSRFYVRYILPQ